MASAFYGGVGLVSNHTWGVSGACGGRHGVAAGGCGSHYRKAIIGARKGPHLASRVTLASRGGVSGGVGGADNGDSCSDGRHENISVDRYYGLTVARVPAHLGSAWCSATATYHGLAGCCLSCVSMHAWDTSGDRFRLRAGGRPKAETRRPSSADEPRTLCPALATRVRTATMGAVGRPTRAAHGGAGAGSDRAARWSCTRLEGRCTRPATVTGHGARAGGASSVGPTDPSAPPKTGNKRRYGAAMDSGVAVSSTDRGARSRPGCGAAKPLAMAVVPRAAHGGGPCKSDTEQGPRAPLSVFGAGASWVTTGATHATPTRRPSTRRPTLGATTKRPLTRRHSHSDVRGAKDG